MTHTPYTIYFAGDMFDHKHLIGNAVLADYIERLSEQRYECHVPQNFEVVNDRSVDVRNIDLQAVMSCDLGIFNFDGPDLDSGTVVEYMFAKMLDIPAVIIRSDFRRSGDGKQVNWNLMATNYPRSEVVAFNSLQSYRDTYKPTGSLAQLTEELYTKMATTVVEALDKVRQEPPVAKPSSFSFDNVYEWARNFPGNGFADLVTADDVADLLTRKRAKGLI